MRGSSRREAVYNGRRGKGGTRRNVCLAKNCLIFFTVFHGEERSTVRDTFITPRYALVLSLEFHVNKKGLLMKSEGSNK